MDSPVILVIDDNPITRKLVRLTLQGEGYIVVEAEDGRSAFELMARQWPDLVLQDLILPDIDGLELLRRLRTLPGGADLPILAFSASLSKTEEARALPLGFTDTLSKPVEPSTLLNTIRAYVEPVLPISEQAGDSHRLLIADDDPARLERMKHQFELLGFRVTTAADGAEALEQARRSRPDAILGDVLMPRLDGFQLCRAVRLDPELAAVPVVLFSAADPEPADEQLARSVGANKLALCAPDLQELSEALLACLSAPSPPPAVAPEEPAREAYFYRMVKQLERRAGLHVGLSNRLAVLEAESAIVGGLEETLKKAAPVEAVLGDLLHHYLNAGGISQGAAYLQYGNGPPVLVAELGYPGSGKEPLSEFFGHAEVLLQVMREGEPLTIPGAKLRGDQAQDLLKQAGARSILITPILLGEERLGVIAMVSSHRYLGDDWTSFSRAIGCQVGQALGLARALGHLRENAEELAEADRRKDEFLAMLAHELRNPLGAISNAIQVMHLCGPANPALQRAGEVAARQVRHMARLIDDLLDVSRITRGQTELRKEPVELAAAISRAIETARPLLEARGHRFSVSIPEEPIQLEADPDRLEQVLSNLLNNAAKYTDSGGRVWVTAQREGEEILVEVGDTGSGISPELLPRIFELFTQGERSLDRSQGGLGIGLTLVQRLVQLHGGSVEVHSEGPGHGSRFRVRLPVQVTGNRLQVTGDRADRLAGASLPVSCNLSPVTCNLSHRILLVEDNVDAALTLAELLELAGHEVRLALDGYTALQTASDFHPELVLLDIGLPGLDGYEVARRLRQQPGSGGMRLVALTGYGREEDRRRAEEAGFDLYLTKPVDATALDRLLAEIPAEV